MPKLGGTPTGTSKRPRPEGGTSVERVRPPEKSRDVSAPGTHMEAVTNIKIAIFKENYPEDKLTEDDQNHILKELGRLFRRTPKEELPHLISIRLGGDALIYVCDYEQSGQWLITDIDNHRLQSGARLQATVARNLPDAVKVALRTKDKFSKSPNGLQK
jgi:hypothetical protein